MTIQTAVLIETLVALGAEVRWASLQHLLHAGPRRRRDRRRPDGRRDRRAPGLRLEGRDARGVLVVHRAGAHLAGRRGPEHDPRRRRRRHAARPQGRRVRGGRRACRTRRRPTRGVRRSSSTLLSASLAEDPQQLDARSAAGIMGVTEETTTGVHRLYQMPRRASCCSRRSTSTTRSPSPSSTTSTAAATR